MRAGTLISIVFALLVCSSICKPISHKAMTEQGPSTLTFSTAPVNGLTLPQSMSTNNHFLTATPTAPTTTSAAPAPAPVPITTGVTITAAIVEDAKKEILRIFKKVPRCVLVWVGERIDESGYKQRFWVYRSNGRKMTTYKATYASTTNPTAETRSFDTLEDAMGFTGHRIIMPTP